MGSSRLLAVLLVAVLTLIGCLEGQQADLGAGGDEGLALDALTAASEPVQADAHDLSLCRDLDALQRGCGGEPVDVAACAQRFACSRRLWRNGVQPAVYQCLRERVCEDEDAEMSCLAVAARGLEPSAAQERFARYLIEVQAECGPVLEVAPGQSDRVYDGLSFCLSESESCAATAACTVAVLQALVAQQCGARTTI